MDICKQEVSLFLRGPPAAVDMQVLVHEVEKLMEREDATSVVVIDAERGDCFGVISLKDIQHFHSVGRNPWATRAWEMCTYKPLAISPDMTLCEAAQLMVSHGINHLVVTNRRKKVVGYLSSLDVLEAVMSLVASSGGEPTAVASTEAEPALKLL